MGRFSLYRRAGHSQKRAQRRTRRCQAEALERRLLLASDLDLLSPAAYELADVNRDSILPPADPLLVINAINRADETQPPAHFDVTGDTIVDAADVDCILRFFAEWHPRADAKFSSGEGTGTDSKVDSKTETSTPDTEETTDVGSGTALNSLSGSGSGSGGGGTSSSTAPVANDDNAYTYGTQNIDIIVTHNDVNASSVILTISGNPSQGTASVNGSRIRYAAHSNATGVGDSFEYKVTDSYGRSDTATVTVTYIEVDGFTLARQESDASWVSVPDGELSWAHDKLRSETAHCCTYLSALHELGTSTAANAR